jgi:outer membrane protein W
MKRSMMLAASFLLVAASAFAQEPSRPNTISVFASDLSITQSSTNGRSIDLGYGAAFDHMFTRRLSGEITVTSQTVRRPVSTFVTNGTPTFSWYTSAIHPIDGNLTYHFLTDNRWKPYLGGGFRYASFTFSGDGPLGRYHITTRSVDPEVSGGVLLQLSRSFGLRVDAKQAFTRRPATIADPDFKASVGLAFRF